MMVRQLLQPMCFLQLAMAQDPDVKSPHRADWDGVVASAPDAYTVVFKLPHAYAPFLDNTTIGIAKTFVQSVQPDAFRLVRSTPTLSAVVRTNSKRTHGFDGRADAL